MFVLPFCFYTAVATKIAMTYSRRNCSEQPELYGHVISHFRTFALRSRPVSYGVISKMAPLFVTPPSSVAP
jgi:hypothetical protein